MSLKNILSKAWYMLSNYFLFSININIYSPQYPNKFWNMNQLLIPRYQSLRHGVTNT